MSRKHGHACHFNINIGKLSEGRASLGAPAMIGTKEGLVGLLRKNNVGEMGAF
mgnify:CR=1 FL=1